MIEVTVDVFSGRPNPSWIVDNETEARDLLKELARNRAVVADIDSGFQGLGFRHAREVGIPTFAATSMPPRA